MSKKPPPTQNPRMMYRRQVTVTLTGHDALALNEAEYRTQVKLDELLKMWVRDRLIQEGYLRKELAGKPFKVKVL